MRICRHRPAKELKEVGWMKGLELAKIARKDGQELDCATWMDKVHFVPKDQFKREVKKELTGRESEPCEIIYFKLYKTPILIVEQAQGNDSESNLITVCAPCHEGLQNELRP
jgi:hypothetical protein